jgi:hypothetical protein
MKFKQLSGAIIVWCCAGHALAHELPENRLTLVMRESNHVSMTFYIDYIAALHAALSPKTTEQEFVLVYASMTPQAFRKELQRAQATLQAHTKVTLSADKVATISNWAWPDATAVQSQLQEIVMQTLVAPKDHSHTPTFEVRADVKANQALDAIKLQLPEELQAVTVVSYRPSQVVIKPTAKAPWIKFPAPQR